MYAQWKPDTIYVINTPTTLMYCGNYYGPDEFTKQLALYTVTLSPEYSTMNVSCSGTIDAGGTTNVSLRIAIYGNGVDGTSYYLGNVQNEQKYNLGNSTFALPSNLNGEYKVQFLFYFNGYGSTDNFITLNSLSFE